MPRRRRYEPPGRSQGLLHGSPQGEGTLVSKADTLRIMDYLAHIVGAIDRIYRYVDGIAEAAFLEDEKTQDAVVRNFEILGAKRLATLSSCMQRSRKSTPMCLGR